MSSPPRPRGGADLAAGPPDATVVGAAPQEARPPPRVPHGHDAVSSGHAANAAGPATGCEHWVPHGKSDKAGRGNAACADAVATQRPWGWSRRGHQQHQGPPEHARRRGSRPPGDREQAGRGNAAHGPRGQSNRGGPPVRSRGHYERNKRRNRVRREKRRRSKARVEKGAVVPPGTASDEQPSAACGRQTQQQQSPT